jgi:hypothetical protein
MMFARRRTGNLSGDSPAKSGPDLLLVANFKNLFSMRAGCTGMMRSDPLVLSKPASGASFIAPNVVDLGRRLPTAIGKSRKFERRYKLQSKAPAVEPVIFGQRGSENDLPLIVSKAALLVALFASCIERCRRQGWTEGVCFASLTVNRGSQLRILNRFRSEALIHHRALPINQGVCGEAHASSWPR